MEKLKMHTPDFTNENIARIAELFPNCVTESRDEKGEVKRAIDFDQLRQELSGNIVEGPQERYQLNWPGKREALLTANAPIAKTLRPCREESVDFDTTKNLFIEGDNLDALKLLQETYLGKVKMIYIDPPYNTGRNLIYKNDFSESTDDFLYESNQEDEFGNKLVANPETNGRFHSDWLSMIYGRLRLAKNLLANDGVLVCAIDENEQATLFMILKEIFGEGGYDHVSVSVIHNPGGIQGTNFSYCHEYAIFVYPNDGEYIGRIQREEVDIVPLRDWGGDESKRETARNCFYPIFVKDDKVVSFGDVCGDDFHPATAVVSQNDGTLAIYPIDLNGVERKWRFARQSVEEIRDDLFCEEVNGEKVIRRRKSMYRFKTVWTDKRYNANAYGSKLLRQLLPDNPFTFPKSLYTVMDSVYAVTQKQKDALIVDLFAGSSTTAHAVLQLNTEDGGNRNFIMVQYPEPIPEVKGKMMAYSTIAEIGKERIRRAGKKIKEEAGLNGVNLDIGFRVLKVDSSSMKDVYYSPDEQAQASLLDQVTNIKEDRTAEDLLFQVLLDWGVDLTLPIVKETIHGKDVFFVDQNALAACFDDGVSEDLIKELAARQPLRVVFRDSGFASDDAKINAEQIFKLKSPTTEVRSI